MTESNFEGAVDPARLPPAALARLIDLAEDAIVTVTADERIVLFNRGATEVFGYQPAEILGESLDRLIPQRYAASHHGYVKEFAEAQVSARVMADRRRVFGLRKNGQEFPAEVTISKFHDNGKLYLNAIVRDITERVRFEETLRALNHDLEARVRARTQELQVTNRQLAQKNEENETFVFSVSHDLRSPLVNLQGFSRELELSCRDLDELFQDPLIPEEIRKRAHKILQGDIQESIGYIHTGVDRLTGIIDALLRLSRLGRVSYELKEVDMTAVVGKVVQSLRVSAERSGATIQLQALPPAWGDPVAIEQVFGNLLANALHYLQPGRPGMIEIGAVAEANDNPSSMQTYFVRDNGVGIPAAYAPQVFQVFRRLNPTLAPGEGMGLVIVRRILDRLGGRIWFESVESEGTVFYVALPRQSHSTGFPT